MAFCAEREDWPAASGNNALRLSATFSLERPPGSAARPARSRPVFAFHEARTRPSFRLRLWRACSACLASGFMRGGVPARLRTPSRHGLAELSDVHSELTRNLWVLRGLQSALKARRREARAQAHRPTDARGRTVAPAAGAPG